MKILRGLSAALLFAGLSVSPAFAVEEHHQDSPVQPVQAETKEQAAKEPQPPQQQQPPACPQGMMPQGCCMQTMPCCPQGQWQHPGMGMGGMGKGGMMGGMMGGGMGMMGATPLERHQMMQESLGALKDTMTVLRDMKNAPNAEQKKRLDAAIKKVDDIMKRHQQMMQRWQGAPQQPGGQQ